MKEIQLTQGQVALVDDEDHPALVGRKWQASWHPTSHTWYAKCYLRGKLEYMHRLIIGAQCGQRTDHIDHNGLNNQRSNLRLCTQSRNQANMRKPAHGLTSRYKGVWRKSGRQVWYAGIRVHGRSIHLGCFADEKEAALAYDKAARAHFGDFALTNLAQEE